MKIRKGFVSNSSSSSFIIVNKAKLNKKELADELLLSTGVLRDSFVYDSVYLMCELMLDRSEELDLLEFAKDFRVDVNDEDEMSGGIFSKIYIANKNNWGVLRGYAGSDGEAEEQLLCEMEIDYENDKIIIAKCGGF